MFAASIAACAAVRQVMQLTTSEGLSERRRVVESKRRKLTPSTNNHFGPVMYLLAEQEELVSCHSCGGNTL